MGEDEKIDVELEKDEEEAPSEEAPVSTSPSKIIKILFYVVGAILLLFLVIGISYLVSKYVQEQKHEREQAVIIAPPPPPLANFDLPPFSITTRDAEPHFAKMTFSLGYESSVELNSELVSRTPQLQHIINVLLTSKGYEDLDSVEDKINLQEELKALINKILINGKVKEIYFREIVIN
jgi:flagellar FliL protein